MFTETGTVLFVDDDEALRTANRQSLELAGLDVQVFASARSALDRIGRDFNGAIVSDIRMPDIDGLAFFAAVRAIDPAIPVILITGHGDVPMAVAALKDGAYDFISKPFASGHLIASVRRALEHRQLVLDNRRLQNLAAESDGDAAASPLLGETPVMVRLRETVAQVAWAEVDVLVEGETGVGKELIARLLHRGSPRRNNGFVAVNCGALPDEVAERQLFGEEGFTDRRLATTGRLEASNGGTLFLDEIDSMTIPVQVRMLRALEEREILPIGARAPRPVNLRVIAAAKRDLQRAVAEGKFREDLLYRINVVRLRVPPLRERRADVPLLFAHFAAEAAQQMRRETKPLSDTARRHLIEHDWPGNVRELRNFAYRAALDIAEEGGDGVSLDSMKTLPERVERFEATVIESVLAQSRGDVTEAVARLGIPRKTFYDKLARHQIDIKAFRR